MSNVLTPYLATTEKPLNVDLPEELHQMIDDHQFDLRVKSRKAAVADLIRRGRQACLEEKKATE